MTTVRHGHWRFSLPVFCLVVLSFICLFFLYGCGGGSGGGSGPGVTVTSAGGIISGKVTAPDELLLKLNLLHAVSGKEVPRAMVWLDTRPDKVFLTDENGAFSFSGVQAGIAHRVVCRFDVAATGELFLTRSPEIVLDANLSVHEAGDLALEKGINSISGVLRDQFGAIVPNARLSLWGMPFKSGPDGFFVTPPMPVSAASEKISIEADGFRKMEVTLPFLYSQNTAAGIDVTLSDNSEPNFSPIVFFSTVPQIVLPGERVQLKISVVDPDEFGDGLFAPVWKSPIGTIETTADRYSVWWTAPDSPGLATVSVSLKDSRGAPGAASVGIAVGGDRNPVIRIDLVQPASGEAGQRIVISGSGFGTKKEGLRVSFNGLDSLIHSFSDSEIVTEVPPGATTGLLLVVCGNGEKSAGVFAVLDPGLTITPQYGPPGTLVDLAGKDFGPDQTNAQILVNGTAAVIQSWTDTLIRFVIPEKAAAGIVTLSLRGREKTAGMFRVTRVFSVSAAKATQGTAITITGEGWGTEKALNSLIFAPNIPATVNTWSDAKVVVTVPAGATSGELKALIQGISFPVQTFFIAAVARLAPERGIPGDEITVYGSGFGETMGSSSIMVAGTRVEVVAWADSQIRFKILPETRPGALVINTNGIETNAINVVAMGITGVSYARRPAGASISVSGYGFGSDTGFVLFGEAISTSFTVWKDDYIETIIPADATGTAPLAVSSLGLRSAPVPFAVTFIDGINETEGWAGREIVITGNNLGSGSDGDQVTFSGVVAPIISWNNKEIHARVPEKTSTGPLVLRISALPIVIEEEFSVFDSYEYLEQSPDWSGPRANSRPLLPGLAEDAAGNLFITDFDNGWVWKISADGTQAKFGNLSKPWGIAISPVNGRLYVAESGQNCLQVFDAEGNYLATIGQFGSAAGDFSSPRGLAFDAAGRLYVADAGNSRVQIFNMAGTPSFMTAFGSNGSGNGQFVYPSGVAVDSSLNVFVADAGNNRVQRFSADSSTSPSAWAFSGWLGSKDPNVSTPGWLVNGSGLPSDKEGGFLSPYGLGLAGDSNLLVADTNNNRVQVFDVNSGMFANQIGAAGTTGGQYNQPLAVVFANDRALIADSSNARIQKSTLTGEYLSQVVPDTTQLNTKPGRIVIDSVRRRVYVLDIDDGSITVFGLEGQVLQIIGSKGSGAGQFYKPEGLALDMNGNVFVADTGNARIHELSPEGAFVRTWGVYGTGSGQFISPRALAVSADGVFVFVVDAKQHRLQKFTRTGSFVKAWGSYGTGDDHFSSPSGVAVDHMGNLYVADTNNNRIKKYTADGVLVGWWGSYDAGAQAFWLDPGSQRTGALSDAEGGFDSPTDVAVDFEGHVFVSDSGNFRVQRFAADQSVIPAGGYQSEIYLGENLTALGVDDWATVYTLTDARKIKRFTPEL
ncbi:MAG: IPT/TIG domain-containing protein [Candidatus Riflebacteria bacterium]|nr:IPT/TIG domain-containing protein [Candidatus Riflebacteria bacterium]